MASIILPAERAALLPLLEFTQEVGENANLSKDKLHSLRLAVEEIAINIMQHGYLEQGQHGFLEIHSTEDAETLTITLIDTAPPFDVTQVPPPSNLEAPLEEREPGGLGIYFALKYADDYFYESRGGRNYTSLVFNRPLQP